MASRYFVALTAAAACLCVTGANAQSLLNGENPKYHAAVQDVFSYLTPAAGPDGWRQPTDKADRRLVNDLIELDRSPLIRRTNPSGAGQDVLMTNMSDYNGYDHSGYTGHPYPDMWYVAAPRVHDYLTDPKNQVDPAEVAARLYQVHGMPADRQLDRIVEFWVPESAIFRPAINPDPNEQVTNTAVDMPDAWTPAQKAAYLKWMQNDAAQYAGSLPYPWTQLGYSYDWSDGARANNEGFTEFTVVGYKYKSSASSDLKAMYDNFPYQYGGEACPLVEIHAVTSIGSYIYYTRDGANVGNFHVYDVCDTLWVGAAYTPVAADPANRTVVIDDTGLVYRGMHVSSPGFTVTNRGVIMGRRYGIDKQYYSQTVLFSGSGTLDNYGLIAATPSGVATAVAVEPGSGANLVLNNYGDIIGNVALAEGNDTVSARGGCFAGDIDGGTGANTFVAEADSRSVVVGAVKNFQTVRVDGTLAGQANVDGTLTNNGGVLAPGTAAGGIGTIAASAYAETQPSEFEVDIAAPGVTPGRLNTGGVQPNDLVSIGGVAALNGRTTIRVNHVSGSQSTYKEGDSFYFLTANWVTVDGAGPEGKTTLACVTDSAFLTFGVWGAVDGKELHLRIDDVAPFAGVATGANNIALAGALDGDLPTADGAYAAFIGDLEFMTAAGFNQAIQRLGPDVYHSVDASMRRTTQYMTDSWAGYLHSRCGRCLCPPGGPDETEAAARGGRAYGKGWNVFAQPFGMFYHERTAGGRTGFEADTSGMEMMVDRWVRDDMIVGMDIGYGHTGVGFAGDYGRAELNILRVGPYLSLCEDAWFLDAMATYGYHDNNVDRNTISNGTYESAYGGNDVSFYGAVGKNYRLRRSVISPLVSLQYIYLRQDPFTETGPGAVALHMAANDLNSLRSRVGMRINGCYTLWRTRLTPEMSVGWAHEYLAADRLTTRFAAGETMFETAPWLVFRDSGYVGAGLTMHLRANMQVYCRYDGEFAGTGSFHGVNGGLALSH